MIPVLVDYATPSAFSSSRDRALVGLSANARRPVRLVGRVRRNVHLVRFALRALGEAIWSDDSWSSVGDAILDPVITVHSDRIFFEAFSQDQSAYVALILDPDILELEGELVTGTTNVDFTAWLWAALGELRSSRETWLRVEPGGFEVRTAGAGGRFEQKVELPEPWVRGFLRLGAAMAMPGTVLTLRPVDLLAALRFLRYTKARISPRALRWELEPGQDARLVLEPWEHVVPLVGASHGAAERRVIRVWGRRRLKLIEGLLPFAERVDVYLKGRALPSFYAVKLPDMTFLLGLSGWSESAWSGGPGFELAGRADEGVCARALDHLRQHVTASVPELAKALGIARDLAARCLERLCRQGRAVFDVETRRFRHRELFEQPVDEAALFPPDLRAERAASLLASGAVGVARCEVRETRKTRKLPSPDGVQVREVVYRDWEVSGRVGDEAAVEIVVNDSGRIIFGRCGCPFFADNVLNQGPCEHMQALLVGSESERRDLPSSAAAVVPHAGAASARAARDRETLEDEEEQEADEEEQEDDQVDE